ncbi:MAG: hypothetical protein IJ039_08115 [Clostridia bacterium]|nr:hypothetical protein [Clostridia bacterium]
MISGTKHTNDDVLYTVFKKHYCPECQAKLKRTKTTLVVNGGSPEARKYDIDPYIIGEVKVQLVDFKCPMCGKEISIEDMKKIEGCYVVRVDDAEAEILDETQR